jgi:hypothetical protein
MSYGGEEMSKAYDRFWTQIEGIHGWEKAKDDVKELVTNPLLWITNVIEYATQNNKDKPGVRGMNEAAWQRVEVALDVLKWLNEE